MNIVEATRDYEKWMRDCTVVVESELKSKHKQMREDVFAFFRGTFYRWAQLWPEVCSDLSSAPTVLASGDLHVGSFGTWRDSEGRLAWGVNDFDESYPLPYTNDLVRLACSAKIVTDAQTLTIKLKAGCEAILEGYRKTLKMGGCPIVLAEQEKNLQHLGIKTIEPADDFWEKLDQLPAVGNALPADAGKALKTNLPDPDLEHKVVRRAAGMGSLGQQRFVAIAQWCGGFIAREAKAMTPSSCLWLHGRTAHRQSYYEEAMSSAIRSPDVFQKIEGGWLIRRLSPDSNRIDIDAWPGKRDEETLLHAMGSEAANVHLGSKRQVKGILKDLDHRKSKWLQKAGKEMAKTIERDWKEYRHS